MKTLWYSLQGVAVVAALAMVGILLVWPETGLLVTWKFLIPLVPLSLLVTPRLWRNLCPIATLSQLPIHMGFRSKRRLPLGAARGAAAVAVIGLFAIVPLRHTIFDQSGLALAIFVLSVVAAAVAGGFLFEGKSGFCSSVCPVLPVERLYGQAPMLQVPHAHCNECDACVRSCIDLEESRSIVSVASPVTAHGHLHQQSRVPVYKTPLGIFALAFPGFIIGFFTADKGQSTFAIYTWILLFATISYAGLALTAMVTRMSAGAILRICGALAVGCYYWFTVPKVANAVAGLDGMDAAAGWVVLVGRIAMGTLILFWLSRGLIRQPELAVVEG